MCASENIWVCVLYTCVCVRVAPMGSTTAHLVVRPGFWTFGILEKVMVFQLPAALATRKVTCHPYVRLYVWMYDTCMHLFGGGYLPSFRCSIPGWFPSVCTEFPTAGKASKAQKSKEQVKRACLSIYKELPDIEEEVNLIKVPFQSHSRLLDPNIAYSLHTRSRQKLPWFGGPSKQLQGCVFLVLKRSTSGNTDIVKTLRGIFVADKTAWKFEIQTKIIIMFLHVLGAVQWFTLPCPFPYVVEDMLVYCPWLLCFGVTKSVSVQHSPEIFFFHIQSFLYKGRKEMSKACLSPVKE